MKKTGKSTKFICLLSLCVLLLLGSASSGLAAKTYTINCVSAWPKGAFFVKNFITSFIDEVQKVADQKYPGELKMKYKGGPEIITANEQIIAVGKGMVDLVYGSPSYYLSKMPELDILHMTEKLPWEEKAAGLYDYLDKLHNQKTNTHFLARNGLGIEYNLFLTKPIKKLEDIKGMKIRVNPSTVPIIKSLGAVPIQMPPSDLFTALERGVVQGQVMPSYVLRPFGLVKVTKYMVFPGMFDSPNSIVVNLDKWKKLPKHLRDLLTDQADIHTRQFVKFNKDVEKKELAHYKEQGMVFINLSPEEAARFKKITREAFTKRVMDKAPVETKKILEYITK